MHILFFTENFTRGGLDTFLLTLVNHWPDRQDRLTLVCNASHPGLETIAQGLARPCGIFRHRIPFYGMLVRKASVNRFFNLLRIVLSPLLQYGFLLFNILAFSFLLKKQGADRLMIINGGYPGGDSCRAMSIAWGLSNPGRPSVHNFHNLVTRPFFHTYPIEWFVDRLVGHFSKAFITVSQAAANTMILRPVIYKTGKTSYIYNGADLSPLLTGKDIRPELGIPARAPLCLMLASYEPRKGHFFLLRAFAMVLKQVPEAHLLICGHGSREEIAAVRDRIRQNALERSVHLFGFRQDAPDLLRSSDVLLIASQEHESFGLTALEAMMNQIPVVATNIGGLPEVVADDDGGYCVDVHDIDSYARKIVLLLSNSPLRREQGQRGFARAQRMFSAAKMALEYSRYIRA